MSDKDITIGLKTAGGDAAAEELKKPTEAIVDLGEVTDDLAKKNAKALQGREEMLRGVLQGVATMKEFGAAIKAAGPELDATFGAENAEKIRGFGEGMESLGAAAGMAAQGFAIGGPMGAAIGGLVGMLSGPVKSEIDSMIASWKDAGAAEAEYAIQLEQSRKRIEMGPTAYREAVSAARNYKQEIQDLTVALSEQQTALENHNRLLAASDRADAAAKDRDDARRIRNGEAPEDVAISRANWDAEQGKRRLEAELNARKSAADKSKDLADAAFSGMQAVANDPSGRSTAKDIDAAIAKYDKAEAQAKSLAEELETAIAIAAHKSREIDEHTATKVEGHKERKTTRVLRENQDEVERGFAAEDRAEKERERQAQARATANQKDAKTAGKIGRDAEKLLPDNVTAKFRSAVQKASEALQDGGTAKELADLAELMSQLGKSTNGAVGGIRSQLAAVKSEIETLRRQLRNKP